MVSVGGWFDRRRFDVDAAVLGFVVALLLFPLRFIASQVYIVTIPLVLGAASGLYLLSVYTDDAVAGLPTLSRPVARLLPSIAFVTMAAMVVVAVQAGDRTRLFYALSGVTGSMIAVQVLFTHERDFNRWLYLLEIVALATVMRLLALHTTPGLIGIDIWTHITELAARIMEQRELGAISYDKHFASPFYHVMVVETALLADVPLRTALYSTLGLAMPVGVLLVYLAGRVLVDDRWAVLAALLYSFGDDVVKWSIHLIPTSQGLLLFLAMLYLLLRVMRFEYRTRDFALLVLFSIAIILTHQVSSFIMLVTVAAAVTAQLLLATGLFDAPSTRGVRKRPANLLGLLVFDAGLAIFTWSLTPYNQGTFLATILSYLRETIRSSAGFMDLAGGSPTGAGDAHQRAVSAGSAFMRALIKYIDVTGFLLLLFGTFVGCLYVIHRRRVRHSVFTLLVAAAVMLVFVLGLPMFGIRNFIPQRWFAFLYAPMAVLAVIGLRYFARGLDPRLFVALAVVFAAAFPMTMAFSSDATLESPAFPKYQTSLGYSQQELAAVETIGRMTGSPSPQHLVDEELLHSDQPYQTVFTRTGAYPSRSTVVTENATIMNRTVYVYREYQSTGAPIFDYRDRIGRHYRMSESKVHGDDQAVLYTNGAVKLFVVNQPDQNEDGGDGDESEN